MQVPGAVQEENDRLEQEKDAAVAAEDYMYAAQMRDKLKILWQTPTPKPKAPSPRKTLSQPIASGAVCMLKCPPDAEVAKRLVEAAVPTLFRGTMYGCGDSDESPAAGAWDRKDWTLDGLLRRWENETVCNTNHLPFARINSYCGITLVL